MLACVAAHAAQAQSCSQDDFASAIDGAGAQLRAFNADAAPKFMVRVRALAAKKGWAEQDFEETAITYLQDARLAELDQSANSLLARIDEMGRVETGQTPDCAKLDDIKSSGIELLAVMKAKNTYLSAKIDQELGTKTAAVAPPSVPLPATPVATPDLKSTVPSTPTVAAPTVPPPKKLPPPTPWSTSTSPSPAPAATLPPVVTVPPPAQPAPTTAPGASPPPSPPVLRPQVAMATRPAPVIEADDGYTIDEIRDATQGFFGSVSTGLAAVIEHAFANSGRPTGYILGQEGGGAFLGGLRYGEGTFYIRSGGTQQIYWHGPSVGLDVGASGARTLILVYKMREPGDLYRVFSGLDGSAFVVGGVGLTLLGGGDMVLAPIRSGIGVRLGASLGYLRFTPTKTWNPF